MDDPIKAPECVRAATENYRWTPVLDGQSGASVYRLDTKDRPTLYLKTGAGKMADDITAEMVRLQWLATLGFVPKVHQFFYAAEQAWLLTTALPGRSAYDCLTSDKRSRPGIVKNIATYLRRLHSLSLVDCPFNSDHDFTMAQARRNVESGQVEQSDFNSDHTGSTAEQIWTKMQTLLPLPFDRVVTHGDFSLSNIFLQDNNVTGSIDVGRVGAADPYQDLAILWRDLEEFGEDVQTSLFEAYGIPHPDPRKLQFHLCLDEFF